MLELLSPPISEPTPTSEIAEPALPAPTFSSEEIGNDAGIFLVCVRTCSTPAIMFPPTKFRADSLRCWQQFEIKLSIRNMLFIAGNTVTFDAATEKDLFAAGKTITIAKNAKVGRDVLRVLKLSQLKLISQAMFL